MLDSDWFGFLLQVVGIAVAGWVALALFGARRRGAFTLALAGVACVLLAGQYAVGVRGAIDYVKAIDKKFAVTDRQGARTWCVNEPGLPDLNFLRFIQANMPRYARYQLFVPADSQGGDFAACIDSVLMPAVHTEDPQRAQYVIFFGDVPAQFADQATDANPRFHAFAPGKGLLEVGG